MTQSFPCADVCLCRSAYGPVAGRPTVTSTRFSRRLSSSFPRPLNDVARLTAEDQEGNAMTIKATDGGPAGKPQLRKSLKLWQVVMMGLAYLTPMTVFDTFGIVSGLTDGHVPTSHLLALAGVLFTAISYGKLVRQFPTAGSAYTYAQKAINPHVGFLVGWSSLLDYLFLPMINTLLAKIYLTALFPEVPPGCGWWASLS